MKTTICLVLMCMFCVAACAPTYGYGYDRSVKYEQNHNIERAAHASK